MSGGNGDGVPGWMAPFSIQKGEWLNMAKNQLRSQQRPDKPLKVQVWATGMLHSPGYGGELACTMRNNKKVPLTPADIVKELFDVAQEYYKAGGVKATPEEMRTRRETKESIRRAMEELEDDGVALRTNKEGVAYRDLTREQLRRLPAGHTRMYFWLTPRAAKPQDVAAEFERHRQRAASQRNDMSKVEVDLGGVPIPPIRKILNVFGIKPGRADLADQAFNDKVAHGYRRAREAFLEVFTGSLPAEPAEVGAQDLPDVGPGGPREVGLGGGTLERKDERNGESPSSSVASSTGAGTTTTILPPSHFRDELRAWMLAHLRVPGFALPDEYVDQIAATIETRGHLEQFQTAALNVAKPRGWKVFVTVAFDCRAHHERYMTASASGEDAFPPRKPAGSDAVKDLAIANLKRTGRIFG